MDCIEIDTRMQSFFSFTMPMIWFFSDTMTADWLFAVVESFIFWRRSIAFLCNPRDIFAADSAQSTSRFSSGFCAFKLWQFGFFVLKKFLNEKIVSEEKCTQGVCAVLLFCSLLRWGSRLTQRVCSPNWHRDHRIGKHNPPAVPQTQTSTLYQVHDKLKK